MLLGLVGLAVGSLIGFKTSIALGSAGFMLSKIETSGDGCHREYDDDRYGDIESMSNYDDGGYIDSE